MRDRKLHLAHLLMRSPSWLWHHYPEKLTDWCVEQHLLSFESVRRLRRMREMP